MMVSTLRKIYFFTNSEMSRAILGSKMKISQSSVFPGAVATALIMIRFNQMHMAQLV